MTKSICRIYDASTRQYTDRWGQHKLAHGFREDYDQIVCADFSECDVVIGLKEVSQSDHLEDQDRMQGSIYSGRVSEVGMGLRNGMAKTNGRTRDHT